MINLKNVDLNLLVIFEGVYSTGNISHAADRLNMSQPAVSNALSRLRDLFDDALFIRGNRGVVPTLKAQAMIGPVREALRLIGGQFHTGDEIDFTNYQRTFRVMMIEQIEPIVMPVLLRIIDEQAPGVAIETPPPSQQFVEGLKEGTLDLACFTYFTNLKEIVAVPLDPVDVVVVARRGHPRIGETIDVETFQSLGHVALLPELRRLLTIDADLAAQNVTRRIVYAVTRTSSLAPAVEKTDLIAMMNRRIARHLAPKYNLAIYESPVKISSQHTFLMWHVRNNDDPGHRWMRETMLAALRDDNIAAANADKRRRR